MTSEMPASPNHNQKYKNYGPPPSDSEDDDFDGMSFGQEFEEVHQCYDSSQFHYENSIFSCSN